MVDARGIGVALSFVLLAASSLHASFVGTVAIQDSMPRQCEVTLPNGELPPDASLGTPGNHGNGELFVALDPDGVFRYGPREDHYSGRVLLRGFIQEDGSIWGRSVWWREVPGPLELEGHRVDGAAPPLAVNVVNGYGDAGLQMVSVSFPTPGCWEMVGRVGDTSLSYVMRVVHWSEAPPQRLPR